MVPRRKTTPTRIRMTGPAMDRCGRGGGMMGGGTLGLATVHLTGGRNWWSWWNGWLGRNWRNRTSRGTGVCRKSRIVSFDRSAALEQFHAADDQQKDGPGMAEAEAFQVQVLQQKQDANGKDYRRALDPPGAQTRALAATASASQAPVAGEHPGTAKDQDQGPEAIDAELREAQGMEQKEHADQNEYDRAHGNFAGFNFRSCSAKCGRQAERIGHRLSHLNGFCRAH